MELYQRKLMDRRFLRYLTAHPAPFYTRFYWQEAIDFEIVNPDVDASWELPPEAYRTTEGSTPGSARLWARQLARHIFSQRRRNRRLDLLSLLRCPTCHYSEIERDVNELRCPHCRASYEIRDGVPVMFPKHGSYRSAYVPLDHNERTSDARSVTP
jgi:uncharacterized protein YbaR (Trm112 family)